jgi:hypothetical protein
MAPGEDEGHRYVALDLRIENSGYNTIWGTNRKRKKNCRRKGTYKRSRFSVSVAVSVFYLMPNSNLVMRDKFLRPNVEELRT